MPSIDLRFFLLAYLKMIFDVLHSYILQKINILIVLFLLNFVLLVMLKIIKNKDNKRLIVF